MARQGEAMETDDTRIETGSGNVFADLGRPDADTHLLKAEIVTRIDTIIRQRRLKQIDAAKLLGLSQSDVSRLLRGNFRKYSLDRLLRLLTALGRDVETASRGPVGRAGSASERKRPAQSAEATRSPTSVVE